MKCHGCSTLMTLDKQETGAGSRTQWHSCPCCGKVRLTSEPEFNSNAGMNKNMGANNSTSTAAISSRVNSHKNSPRKNTPNFA